MNKLKGEHINQGRSLAQSNMTEAFPTISQEKRRRLKNAKPTKENLGDINAYRFELKRDIALAETAEIT
jgi:hypothetical protein